MPTPLQPGDRAPAFAAVTSGGQTIALDDYHGRWLVLYAYPKDDTPGCTRQACALRDGWDRLATSGVQVLGVSPDDEASHARFSARYGLPFPLLPDPEHEILRAYGVWGERTLYGRKTVGVTRTTFLIAPDGRIAHVFRRPDVDHHADEILARVENLRQGLA